MRKIIIKLFVVAISITSLCLLASSAGTELFSNGDFEDGTNGWIVSSKLTSLVQSNYGKSLKLIKPFNSKSWSCAYRTIELDPAKTYELSFDFQPDNIQFGGEVRIEFSEAKHKAIIQSFDAHNTTWNQHRIEFKPVAKQTQIMIRLWPGEEPGSVMLLDNVSLRESGNLLVPWSKRNINPKHQLHNGAYYYKILSGKAMISCDNSSFKQDAISDSQTELIILSSAVKPLTEYKFSLDCDFKATDKIVISIQSFDIDKKPIDESVQLLLKSNELMHHIFTTPAGTVWSKITLNLNSKQGNKIMLSAPVLTATQ